MSSAGGDYPGRPHVPLSLHAFVVGAVCENLVLRSFVRVEVVAGLAAVLVALFGTAWLASLRRGVGHGTGVVFDGDNGSRDVRPVLASCLVLCLVALMSCGLSALALSTTDSAARWLSEMPSSQLSFEVGSDASETSSGWLCRANGVAPDGRATRVWLTVPEQVRYGETLTVVGTFSGNEEDDWGRTSRAQGIAGRVRVRRVTSRVPATGLLGVLMTLRQQALEAIKPQDSAARALLAGVVVADRTELKRSGAEDDFATTGLSHLVAVSGSHLVVVGAGLESMLVLVGAGPRFRAGSLLVLTGCYVVLCACPASAVRSWVMLAAARGGVLFGRRSHSVSGMALTGLVMCLAMPSCVCDLGFQLSALSVCALALFSPLADGMLRTLLPSHELPRLPPVARKPLVALVRLVEEGRSTLAASLVCQLATAPACAATFGTLSLVAPLANVVAGPLFGPMVSLGVAGAALSCLPVVSCLGAFLLLVANALSWLALAVVAALARLPFACVAVELGAAWELVPLLAAPIVLVAWPRPSRWQLVGGAVGAMTAMLSLTLGVSLVSPTQVVVFDVGQGDAILLRRGWHAVLVDTGPAGELGLALARQHVYALDAVILTHLHDDHTGGLGELASLLSVGRVYVGDGVADGLPEEVRVAVGELGVSDVEELRAGEALEVAGFTLTCLWPMQPVDGSENEHSLCLLARYGEELSVLLTGDAERDVMAHVVPAAGDVDVLKVGHHGSKVSIDAGQAEALAPEVAVASAGEANSYGHPSAECVGILERAGAQVLCTKDVGDVAVYPGKEGPRVKVETP